LSEIVEIFEKIVSNVSDSLCKDLYYQHGHIIEIDNTLKSKSKTINLRDKKYPLIMLLQPFNESKVQGHTELSLRLIICTGTKSDIVASERYSKVFKPVLVPVYDALIEEIANGGYFFIDGDIQNPPHNRIDRPFYGVDTSNGNVRYLMSDKLDAIEITDLQLNYYNNKC